MVEYPSPTSDLILYRTEDGRTRVEVHLADEKVCRNSGGIPGTVYIIPIIKCTRQTGDMLGRL